MDTKEREDIVVEAIRLISKQLAQSKIDKDQDQIAHNRRVLEEFLVEWSDIRKEYYNG